MVRTLCIITTNANELVGRGTSEAFSVRTTRVGEEEPGCAPRYSVRVRPVLRG